MKDQTYVELGSNELEEVTGGASAFDATKLYLARSTTAIVRAAGVFSTVTTRPSLGILYIDSPTCW